MRHTFVLVGSLLVVCAAACAGESETASDPKIEVAQGGSTGLAGSSSTTGGGAGQGQGQGGSAATDPCDHQMDGTFCGERIGQQKGTLYVCENHVAVLIAKCDAGCVMKMDKADADVCQSDATEPCFNDPDGVHCGETIGGKPNVLYTCKDKKTAKTEACPASCIDKAGGASYCQSDATEPCFNDPDGDYCGDSIGATDGKGKLYQCKAHLTAGIKTCADGCVDKPGGTDVCQGDANEPCFNDGDGFYCGAAIGGDPAYLYHCVGKATASKEKCDGGCLAQPAGVPDVCGGNGKVTCGVTQWWNTYKTYGPYVSSSGWWDTDLGVPANSKVQLRHDSKLVAEGTYGWGWMPTFVDQKTGYKFRMLHLRPQNKYATEVGKIYPAGFIVGISGGDTADTGKPTYSTGAHLCIQTIEEYATVFPGGTEPCQ